MPGADTITAIVGCDMQKTLTLLHEDQRTPVTTFTMSAALAASIGYGDDRAPAFAPSVAWDDPAAGTITLSWTAAQTASLTPGLYRLYLTVTASGLIRGSEGPIALVKLLPKPAAATVGAVYCTMDDVLRYGPFIEDLITLDPRMQSDLAEQRARARTWLDELILVHWRPDEWNRTGGRAPVDASFGANSWYGRYVDPAPDKWLRDQLALGVLMIRGWVIEVTAKMTLFYTCENQFGKMSDGGTTYHEFARRCRADAEYLAMGKQAELDFNGDSWPDRQVRLGLFTTR